VVSPERAWRSLVGARGRRVSRRAEVAVFQTSPPRGLPSSPSLGNQISHSGHAWRLSRRLPRAASLRRTSRGAGGFGGGAWEAGIPAAARAELAGAGCRGRKRGAGGCWRVRAAGEGRVPLVGVTRGIAPAGEGRRVGERRRQAPRAGAW
jgi:hypothetical protein